MHKRIALALTSSLLLYLAWPTAGHPILLFVAFIPLLMAERSLSLAVSKYANLQWFIICFLCFALWNLGCTWWLANDHWLALTAVLVINAALMALALLLFRFVKAKLGPQRGYISLPFIWVSMESLHKYWSFDFPWLWLGNGFATQVEWVQWYEHVGVFGGSWWIWLVNLSLWGLALSYMKHQKWRKLLIQAAVTLVLMVALPIFLSYQRYWSYQPDGQLVNAVVVQPNTAAGQASDEEAAQNFVRLSRPELGDSTDFILGPENFLRQGLYLEELQNAPALQTLLQFSKKYPMANLVVGTRLLQSYRGPYTTTAQPSGIGTYRDIYNSALWINNGEPKAYRHKIKLVAGAEKDPLQGVFSALLEKLLRAAEISAPHLGTDAQPRVFTTTDGLAVAPLICWESDFGEFAGGFVRQGASLLFILTNDGLWGNSPGPQQHKHYARLRAVEYRRDVARSASTGLSCFINQRGVVVRHLPFDSDGALSYSMHANEKLTYYAKVGDLLARLSHFLAGFLLLFALVQHLKPSNDLKGS